MKPNELREKSIAELNEELVDLKEELFKLRFPARHQSTGESPEAPKRQAGHRPGQNHSARA